MIWQRRVRLLLAVTAVACAVAVFLLRRERPDSGTPLPVESRDPAAVMELGSGRRSLFPGVGAEAGPRFTFESFSEYEGGRVRATGVHAVFDGDGLEVWADVLDIEGAPAGGMPSRATFTGNVRARDADGLELQTAEATYAHDEERVTMPGDVTFASGRLSGQSHGASFDRAQQIVHLLEAPELTIGVEGETTPTRATASTMTLARLERFARLDGEAVIRRPTETLEADTATIYLTDDEQQVRLVDLSGSARVVPVDEAATGPPAMTAEAISLTFQTPPALERATLTTRARLAMASGQVIDAAAIDAWTGPDGTTVTRLTARDEVVVTLPAADAGPARRITAGALTASGDETDGLTTARFDRDVVFSERTGTADESREGRAESLLLGLDGELSAIRQAEFRGDASFEAGDVTAESSLATYRMAEGKLELRPTSSTATPARVTTAALAVDARLIDLWIDDDRVEATGDVVTVSAPDADADVAPGFFSGGDETIGTSRQFFYDGGAGEARYVGVGETPARLTGPESRVEALEIVLNRTSGNLTATEGVRTTGVVDAPSTPEGESSGATTYEITADRLAYTGADHTAVYSGGTVRLTARDMSSEAEEVTLVLAPDSAIDHIVWEGAVHATLEGGYEAVGSRLEHEPADGRYLLRGRPARLKSRDEAGCTVAEGAYAVITPDGTPPIQWPGAENQPGRVQFQPVDCAVTLQ